MNIILAFTAIAAIILTLLLGVILPSAGTGHALYRITVENKLPATAPSGPPNPSNQVIFYAYTFDKPSQFETRCIAKGTESCDLNLSPNTLPPPSYHVFTSPLPKDACPKSLTYTLEGGQVFSDTYIWSLTPQGLVGETTLYLLSPTKSNTGECDLSEFP